MNRREFFKTIPALVALPLAIGNLSSPTIELVGKGIPGGELKGLYFASEPSTYYDLPHLKPLYPMQTVGGFFDGERFHKID